MHERRDSRARAAHSLIMTASDPDERHQPLDVGDYVMIVGAKDGQPIGWVVELLQGNVARVLTKQGSILEGRVLHRSPTRGWRERNYGFHEGVRLALCALAKNRTTS